MSCAAATGDGIALTAEQLDEFTSVTPPAGDHHSEARMRMLDRDSMNAS